MYDHVGLKEELERKTIDALERLAVKNASGEINDRELYLAASALYDATSGLVDQTIQRLIAATTKLRSLPT